MDFENFTTDFALARDLFYLAAVLTGAALGCILNRFRRSAKTSFRNRTVSAAMAFFSGTVAALAAVFILSRGEVFPDIKICAAAAVFTLIITLAFRFPLAAGFPAILAAGIIAVWVGITFLRYPVFSGDPAALPAALMSSAGVEAGQGRGEIDFSLDKINAAYYFPLAGGETRAFITELKKDGEVFFSAARALPIFPWGFSVEEIRGRF